jgi:hypothetical protein
MSWLSRRSGLFEKLPFSTWHGQSSGWWMQELDKLHVHSKPNPTHADWLVTQMGILSQITNGVQGSSPIGQKNVKTAK